MPTIATHAVTAAAILTGVNRGAISRHAWLVGAACAMLPDADVIGFSFGVRYGDLLGHRGLTHSVAFAVVVATPLMGRVSVPGMDRARTWLFLFLCTVSHGVLDAATNGGLGIAFLSPLSNHRYFWPWRPLVVSPIGLNFLQSPRAMRVIYSELLWIWLPSAAVVGVSYLWRADRRGRAR